MRILGIETSCDETAAAVVEFAGQRRAMLLSNVVASSINLHKKYGGVVPEIAARSHIEAINPVINEALEQAGCSWKNIGAIGVTYGPGLGGSLLVGLQTAKTLAIIKNKPLYAVNHVAAHVSANFLTSTSLPAYNLPKHVPKFPLLALIVSGGHTQLVLFEDHFKYTVLGRTLDDAVGEAFDKVAKIIGLPYPGGPSIEKITTPTQLKKIDLPKAKTPGRYDFSYSGLKTAVLRAAQSEIGEDHTFPSHQLPARLSQDQKASIAISFKEKAVEMLVDKLLQAYGEFAPESVVIAGGVAASPELRVQISSRLPTEVEYTDIKLCTDNGAMIAANSYYQIENGIKPADPYSLDTNPSLMM